MRKSIIIIIILCIIAIVTGTIIILINKFYKKSKKKTPIPDKSDNDEPEKPIVDICKNQGDLCENKNMCFPVNGILKCEKPDIEYNVTIEKLLTDIYKKNDKNNDKKDIVIIHGGGLVKGDKSSSREEKIAIELSLSGYNVYVPNYSIGPESFPKNFIEITDFIKNIYSKNKKPVYVISFSAGSLLILNSIFNEDMTKYISGIVIFYGITNPLSRKYVAPSKTGKHGIGDHRSGHLSEVLGSNMCVSCKSDIPKIKNNKFCNDTELEKNKLHCLAKSWNEANPIGKLNSKTKIPKTMIIHGENDKIVNFDQAIELKKELSNIGIDITLINVPNGEHGFGLRYNNNGSKLDINLYNDIINFFD